jgi:hypothetical protein
MRHAAARVVLLAAWTIAVPGVIAAQTLTPAPAGKPLAPDAPKATASVRGRITAADTGRGLRRAQVSISGGELTQRRTAATNTRGDFEIRDLPAGRYTISAARSGYLAFEYGQRRPGERGKTVELSDGEAMTGIDVALPRGAVISGRVVDENAEPVPNVNVWVMRPEFFRGRRRMVPMAVGLRTDDIGQYRATGLAAGEYVVMATIRETWVAPGEKRQVLGYAPTYFPSTASLAEAQHVKLAAGKEASNTDVVLVAAPAADISGTARRSDGTPLAGASVALGQSVFGPGGSSFSSVGSAAVGADGGWVLHDVPPGEYDLSVTPADRTAARESAEKKIVMQGVDVDGVSLVTEADVRITGEIVSDSGVALPPAPMGRYRVTVDTTGERRPNQIPAGDDSGVVKADGTFAVTSTPGLSLVRVGPLPRGWALKTIEVGGREVVDGALELRGGQNVDGMRIVVTDRYPSVSGRITDERAMAAEGTVVMFPTDDTRWLTATTGIRSGRTDQKGIFRFEAVAPGDYFVAALDAVQNWEVNDPEFLAQLRDRAERLTVREGPALVLSLRLIK